MDIYGKMLDPHTVQFVRILPGPIENIWNYIADGKKRGEWFASGMLPTKVGESFELRFKHSELSPNKAPPPDKYIEMDKTGHTSTNILLACEPPHLLAFTFGPETRPGETSEVEFRLSEEGDKVRLTLTHRKIPNLDFAAGTRISPSWKTRPMAASRPPSGTYGVEWMALMTSVTPSPYSGIC
jgi:uncharacterized protein YndB with AHSA1/START domain